MQQVAAVKRAVAEMRETAKRAVSHREKCCMIVSAAMAASVALDQVQLLQHARLPFLTCIADLML